MLPRRLKGTVRLLQRQLRLLLRFLLPQPLVILLLLRWCWGCSGRCCPRRFCGQQSIAVPLLLLPLLRLACQLLLHLTSKTPRPYTSNSPGVPWSKYLKWSVRIDSAVGEPFLGTWKTYLLSLALRPRISSADDVPAPPAKRRRVEHRQGVKRKRDNEVARPPNN